MLLTNDVDLKIEEQILILKEKGLTDEEVVYRIDTLLVELEGYMMRIEEGRGI